MSLGIYTDTSETSIISASGVFNNPLSFTADSDLGLSQETQLFLHNTSSGLYYENITVEVLDSSNPSKADGSQKGWLGRVYEKATRPTSGEWYAASQVMSYSQAIGSASEADSSYHSFWLRMDIPKNIEVQAVTTLSLRLEADEESIT